MNNRLEAVQNKFLENIGHMSDAFGLNSFVAKLYGFLYLNAKPLSLDEIAEALGASKGNVSINIRILEDWGAVRKIWIKGSRKDYYEADNNIKRVLANKFKSALQKRISDLSEMIADSNRVIQEVGLDLSEEEKRIAKVYKERLKKIEELKTLALTVFSLADKLL